MQLVEARLRAVQTQYKMAVLQLRIDKQPTKEGHAEKESREASLVQRVPVTDKSAEAGSARKGTKGAAKERGATGIVANSRGTAGSAGWKRSAGSNSAVLLHTSAERSIVGRHVQVHISLQWPICLLHCSNFLSNGVDISERGIQSALHWAFWANGG